MDKMEVKKWWFVEKLEVIKLCRNAEDGGELISGAVTGVEPANKQEHVIVSIGMSTHIRRLGDFDAEASGLSSCFAQHLKSRTSFVAKWKEVASAKSLHGTDNPNVSDAIEDAVEVTERSLTAAQNNCNADFISQKCAGVHMIPVSAMVAPKDTRLARTLCEDHVRELEASILQNPSADYTILAANIVGLNTADFQLNGNYQYEIIGGNHTRQALQNLEKRGSASVPKSCRAKLFCNLSYLESLQVALAHNAIHDTARKDSLMDVVQRFRRMLYMAGGMVENGGGDPPSDKATVGVWKKNLTFVMGYQNRKELNNKMRQYIHLAQMSAEAWSLFAKFADSWLAGEVQGQPKKTCGQPLTIYHARFLDVDDKTIIGQLQGILEDATNYRTVIEVHGQNKNGIKRKRESSETRAPQKACDAISEPVEDCDPSDEVPGDELEPRRANSSDKEAATSDNEELSYGEMKLLLKEKDECIKKLTTEKQEKIAELELMRAKVEEQELDIAKLLFELNDGIPSEDPQSIPDQQEDPGKEIYAFNEERHIPMKEDASKLAQNVTGTVLARYDDAAYFAVASHGTLKWCETVVSDIPSRGISLKRAYKLGPMSSMYDPGMVICRLPPGYAFKDKVLTVPTSDKHELTSTLEKALLDIQ